MPSPDSNTAVSATAAKPTAEVLGTPKPKESLSGLLRARTVLQHDHGRLHVRMAAPLSLRDFTDRYGPRPPRQPEYGAPIAISLPVSTHTSPVPRHLVHDLAYEIVRRQQVCGTVWY